MNRKIVLLILLAVIISLMSGITYSIFTDISFAGEGMFITGSNEVEIVEIMMLESSDSSISESADIIGESGYDKWKPGEENAIPVRCKFRNLGDQDSSYSVRISAGWTNDATNIVHWIQTSDVKWIEKDSEDFGFIYPEVVRPREEVEISFYLWCESIIGLDDASYTIDLVVESSQKH